LIALRIWISYFRSFLRSSRTSLFPLEQNLLSRCQLFFVCDEQSQSWPKIEQLWVIFATQNEVKVDKTNTVFVVLQGCSCAWP
jgi:hypothetical protein